MSLAEPSQADISAVAAAIGETPQPAATPPAAPPAVPPAAEPAQPQMQPAPVTPQPAPTQQQTDPFASLFASQPTEPAAPVAAPPIQPTEPVAQPATPPAEPQVPTTPTQPPESIPGQSAPGEEQYQSFEEYMNEATGGIGEAPAQPDPEKIDPNDPSAIKNFFDDLVNTAVSRAEQAQTRKASIQSTERNLWDSAFNKYGSLKQNKPLRDMVHSIRMGHFQRGQAITPTQAADKLLNAMKQQYLAGVADNQVVTTIENVQPAGGGTGTPIPTTLDKESDLTAVQAGGETALAEILDREIKAGRL